MTIASEKTGSKAIQQNTITLTAAQAVIRYLSKQKVELFDGSFVPLFGGVWGIFGHGNVAGIGEALWQERDSIPYFRGQNEQGMAHAAIAYAKANRGRRVMAVTSSIGPGATNMVTACALAHVNRLPVLFLPGDVYSSRRPDPVLQQLEVPGNPTQSVNDCFAPVSRYFDRITRPEQLLTSLPQVIRTLLSPTDRGPVTLSLPQDTQAEQYQFPNGFFDERIHYIERQRADRASLIRAEEILKAAQKPLIIAGGGVHYSGAEHDLLTFAQKHGIPVAETQAGKGSLPWDHPYNVGAIGVTGTSVANELAKDADVILAVGTRLLDFTTASKSLFHRHGVKIISLNVSEFDTCKGDSAALVCDALEGLRSLGVILGTQTWQKDYESKIRKMKLDWFDTVDQFTKTSIGELPSDGAVVKAVNDTLNDNDIIVAAAGGLPGELHKLWRVKDSISYHLEYGYSCMGYEIAGALGVKMAFPERDVYAFVGDGSYLMMHQELVTANQLGVKITVILLDNRGFGCIHRLQSGCGSPPFGNLFTQDSTIAFPDYVKNAESFGCRALKVSSIEELPRAIQKSKKSEESFVIVIDTDPEKSSPSYAWWDVAVAEVSKVPGVQRARSNYEEKLEEIDVQTNSHWS